MEKNLIHQGKVRDIYEQNDNLLMITSDRLSAFDRAITTIPHKASVLNLLSVWWFEQTKHIINNHLISCPNHVSMKVKKCNVFPVEVIVRGYITGTTNTSIWTLYQQGERQFFNTSLPDGLRKNTKLPEPILTPTTKEKTHDRPLTTESIQNWIDTASWQYISQKALELFKYGQDIAAKNNLILVDTKYEFGIDDAGKILLVDECHTPDSSRYWNKKSYKQCIEHNDEPESFDKEFLRLWYKNNCDPYNDPHLPDAPDELIAKASKRYTQVFESLTGQTIQEAIIENKARHTQKESIS